MDLQGKLEDLARSTKWEALASVYYGFIPEAKRLVKLRKEIHKQCDTLIANIEEVMQNG